MFGPKHAANLGKKYAKVVVSKEREIEKAKIILDKSSPDGYELNSHE